MKMPAGLLTGCATRVENCGALPVGQAGKVEVLESGRRYCRDLCPMPDRRRSRILCLAKCSIGRIVAELECKQLQREAVKMRLLESDRTVAGGIHEFPQPGSQPVEAGIEAHAVFICPGWFSATARKQYVTAKRSRCKGDSPHQPLRSSFRTSLLRSRATRCLARYTCPAFTSS